MPALTPADIQHLARLARLDIPEAEQGRYATQLDRLLGLFESLKTVDTAAIGEVFASFADLEMTPRPDAPGPCLDLEAALSPSGRREGEFIAVPRVLAGAPEPD